MKAFLNTRNWCHKVTHFASRQILWPLKPGHYFPRRDMQNSSRLHCTQSEDIGDSSRNFRRGDGDKRAKRTVVVVGLESKTCFQALLLIPSHSHKPQAWHRGPQKDWVKFPWQDNQQQQQELPHHQEFTRKSAGVEQSSVGGEQGYWLILAAWENNSVWR